MSKRKEVWTPEKAQRRRELKGWSPIDNRETRLPDSIYETGRELTRMMRLSTAEFVERYLDQARQ
jgi:hypothetical protein